MNQNIHDVDIVDREQHLHPYTNARQLERDGPLTIVRGDGIYVFDSNGNRYIEGMSGLWSVAVGFSEPRLADAAAAQLGTLPYYHTFSGMTHPAVANLASKLIEMCPLDMSRAFFTNSGSEANDTAIKMVWYRANALGLPTKKKIISRRNAYHGVTAMSASLTGLQRNHLGFDLPLSGVTHAMTPHYRPNMNITEGDFTNQCLTDLEELIEREGAGSIAAFIAEPVIGAGGVLPPPKGYWKGVQGILRANDILLIADEVITGFGRTGNMFACQTYGIQPDLLILSKQLSSSYQPIAAVLIADHVYQPIADMSAEIGVFSHGFTCSGHPVAAAVALENIRIIEERDLVGNVRRLAPRFRWHLDRLLAYGIVREVRSVGLLGAFEFNAAIESPSGTRGAEFQKLLLSRGLICRNIGDAVAMCPPMITTEPQLEEMFEIIERCIKEFGAGY